jgi:hypothetical protein
MWIKEVFLAPAPRKFTSRLVAHNFALAIAGPDRRERAENQARAGNNDPKMKDPVSQAD